MNYRNKYGYNIRPEIIKKTPEKNRKIDNPIFTEFVTIKKMQNLEDDESIEVEKRGLVAKFRLNKKL